MNLRRKITVGDVMSLDARIRELSLQLAESHARCRRLRRALRKERDYTFRLLDEPTFYRHELSAVVATTSPRTFGDFGRLVEHEEPRS
jgi:hypothetical protein